MKTYLLVRCPACKAEKKIAPGEVPEDDYPLCEKDGMPLIAVRAVTGPG